MHKDPAAGAVPFPLDEVPLVSRMSPADAAERLREMGEAETAAVLERRSAEGNLTETFRLFGRRELPAYLHTAHTLGFVPARHSGDEVGIHHASDISADEALRGQRLNITLNGLRVADYPGTGQHHVLFDFAAQNQALDGSLEYLHFNQVVRGIEGGSVGVIGYPIFRGLRVGTEGLAFRCGTVNVKNEQDQPLLQFLDGDVFKAGLRLAEMPQPAIAPLSEMVVGLTRMVAKRHRNVAVQDVMMGFDFSDVPGGARLAEGLFFAVQIPERDRLVWDWSDWVYKPSAGRVVKRRDAATLIPYNYLSFGIARHHGS